MFQYAVDVLSAIFALLLLLCGSYYLAVAVFSFAPYRSSLKESGFNRFAVIIPAHNEAEVLPQLLKSIRRSNYPQSLISVYVIADGCEDITEDIAKKMGAKVIKRSAAHGKGEALTDGIAYLLEKDKLFDCITVIDADNIVDEFYFSQVNEHILSGEAAVQGYVDSKNPYDSWVANAYSVWYWITNRIFQTGRYNLGIGCRLNGTGFTITRRLAEKVPWQTSTEAEDAEYTCVLAENGVKVCFAKNAKVYDEKPVDFLVSVSQRKRWSRGVFDVIKTHSFRLIKKARINAVLGLWSDFLSPLVYVLIFIMTAFGVGTMFKYGEPTTYTAFIYLIAYAALVLAAVLKDGRQNVRPMGFLLYLFSWLPIVIIGLFSKNSEWYHTKHKFK